MEGTTVTLSIEGTDTAKQLSLNGLINYITGRTITATREPTDPAVAIDFINAIGGMTNTREQLESTDIR